MKKSIFSNISKPNVLIFGTGKGGESVYRSNKSTYNVLGFIDNNLQLSGNYFFNKKIYAPSEIKTLNFDQIIIASDYYKDIHLQLTSDLNISKDLIHIFSSSGAVKNSYFSFISEALSRSVIEYFGAHNSSFSKFLFSLLSCISHKFKNLALKKITWLDELSTHKIKVFRQQAQGVSSPPKIIGQSHKTQTISIPEVNLYRFKAGRIMTTVNGVIFEKSNIALTRVPSYTDNWAQYSAGFLKAHGQTNALIKKQPSTQINQGIAIIGANDTNYYHWVIEVLCKLQFIAELPDEFKDFPILISEQALKIDSIKAYISYLNINREIIYLKSCHEYQINDLLFISSANYLVTNLKPNKKWSADACFVRSESLTYLRDAVLKKLKNKNSMPRSPQKIFLARKGTIRDYNQEEVFNCLKLFGFEAIYLEDYNLLQQAQLMQNAKVIIGPTGAAWTNLIFCNSETKALCWMAEEYGNLACFSNLAHFSGVDMQYFTYQVNKQNSRELYYSSYTIDINKVKLWLEDNC